MDVYEIIDESHTKKSANKEWKTTVTHSAASWHTPENVGNNTPFLLVHQ